MFGLRTSYQQGLLAPVPVPAPTLWTSTPVLRERCSCGAHTEKLATTSESAEAYFEKWRAEHACTNRKTT